jgi:hypothetical protein
VAKLIVRSQINGLVKAARDLGLGPNVITLGQETKGKLVIELPFKIATADPLIYFVIDHTFGTYDTRFFPVAELGPSLGHSNHSKWESVLSEFTNWAERVKQEFAEPDPWLLLAQDELLLSDISLSEEDNEKLSERDLILVREFVDRTREFLVSEVGPDEEQLALINKRLRDLEESAKTQDKKAWTYTVVGVAFTIASSLSLSPEQGHKLFALVSDLLKTIVLKLLAS